MTLNIMAISRSHVYLTGDFRLTNSVNQNFEDKFDVEKLIEVGKFTNYWGAIVSFTGIAEYDKVNVSKWLSETLVGIPDGSEFEIFKETLLSANNWFCKIPKKIRSLTISSVGFIRRKTFAMMVSNFQDIYGNNLREPTPELRLTFKTPKKPEIFILGDSTSIRLEEKAQLLKAISKSHKPIEMHEILYKLNVKASERSKMISPECVTGHLQASGNSSFIPHGIGRNQVYMPKKTTEIFTKEVIDELRKEESLKKFFDSAGNFKGSLVQSASGKMWSEEMLRKKK